MPRRNKNKNKQPREDDEIQIDATESVALGTKAPPASTEFPDGVDGFDVRAVFAHLTRWTTPRGFEWKQFDTLLTDLGFTLDATANYQGVVMKPDGTMPETVFIAHMDTVGQVPPKRVEQFINGDYMFTDGKTILGADDKAGCTVLLYLLHKKVPGFYVFAWGEENGREGSRALTTRYSFGNFKRAIAFDRRGTTSIITRQSGQVSCSDEFADALAAQFAAHGVGLEKDTGGSFTDTVSFFGEVPECTNISVGYHNAHSPQEIQDLAFLEKLCYAAGRVDWENLPTAQDPKKRFQSYVPTGNYQGTYGGAYAGSRGNYQRGAYGGFDTWGDEDWKNPKGGKEAVKTETPKQISAPKNDAPWGGDEAGTKIAPEPVLEMWDELLEKMARNTLKPSDVEHFFYAYPEEACVALYQMMRSSPYQAQQLDVRLKNAQN